MSQLENSVRMQTPKGRRQAKETVAESTPVSEQLQRALRESALFIFGCIAIYMVLALVSYHPADPGWSRSGVIDGSISNLGGPMGAWFADVFLILFGYWAYLFPIMLAFSGFLIYQDARQNNPFDQRGFLFCSIGFFLTLSAGCGLASLHDHAMVSSLPIDAGGILGDLIAGIMEKLFSFLGATILLLAVFFSGFTLFTNLSWFKLMDLTGGMTIWVVNKNINAVYKFKSWILSLKVAMDDRRDARKDTSHLTPKVVTNNLKRNIKIADTGMHTKKAPKIAPTIKQKQSVRSERERQVPLFANSSNAVLPPLSLLDEPGEHIERLSDEALQAISRTLEIKLADFGITVEVESVHPGPVVTRFEIQPAPGVKVSQITNLAKDLARSLSTISVRVVEVIPGKTTIGIEIPNENREIVRLSETFKAPVFSDAKSPLTLALGKDISGEPIVADLAKMPHLLVAGTTGSGKSVALNAMILSLLYNATPEDVRLIMIDPKMLELSIYDDIPHLLSPVVTDMSEASSALRWCVAEMEQRYKLMSALKVRNIAGYNRKVKDAIAAKTPIKDPLHPKDSEVEADDLNTLPYIVVVVDELADMMMVVGKKVEELIARLAQKARAAGIHLILATQRPSVDVLTGLIKSNIPTRVAFQVSSKVDSRTILDQMGAEQLLGHGDMLYMPPGTAVPIRVHGAFVDDHEVQNVVENLKLNGKPQYEDEVLNGKPEPDPGLAMITEEDVESDPLYDQAVRIVTETRKASISGVQRRLKIGYNRAARMVEAMEHAGLVSELGSNGQREVLAPPPPQD